MCVYYCSTVVELRGSKPQVEKGKLNFDGLGSHVSASGSPTLGMLVEMLVERVFLVGGVVKTVFCRFKKK